MFPSKNDLFLDKYMQFKQFYLSFSYSVC